MLFAIFLLAFAPPPVSLGEAGLSLGFTLYEGDGETWAEAAEETSEDVAIDDLDNGSYIVTGLPDANGELQYRFALHEVGAEEVDLAEIVWGAEETRIAAQLVYDYDTSGPVKVDDTFGSVQLVVERGLTAAINTATATAAMRRERTNIFTARVADIEDITDAGDGTYGARFVFDVQAGDFLKSGRYRVEFRVTYTGGAIETLPKTQHGLVIEAVDRIE